MSNFTVDLPYKYYPDPTKGKPVYLGYIYVGEPNTDPEIVSNQKAVTIDGVTPISQPIRTSTGGVPDYNGAPAVLFVDGDYSIKVLNNKEVQVYYAAEVIADIAPRVDDILISDLSQSYEFPLLDDAANTLIDFPIGKVINLKDITNEKGGAATFEVQLSSTVTAPSWKVRAMANFPLLSLVQIDGLNETTGDVTYYVSPTGSDLNDGLTVGSPFLTINYAVAQVPRYIKHNIVIDLHSATVGVKTYNEDVFISTAFRTMNIETGQYGGYSIAGDGPDTKVQSVIAVKSDVSITGMEIQQDSPVISAESGGIMFWWCSGEAAAADISYAVGFGAIAINAFASNVELRTINGDNCARLVRAKRGSNVQVRFCLGAVDASAGGGIYDTAEVSKITIRDNTAVTRIAGSWYDGDQGCEIHDYDRNRIMTDSIKQMVRMESTSLKLTRPNNFAGTTAPAAKGWSGRTALEIENMFMFANDGSNSGGLTANLYNDGSWRYARDGAASIVSLGDDVTISTAPTGVAGNIAVFTEALRIRNVDGRMFSTPTYNNTTANAANMVVDATGIIQRSTSSMKYKKDAESITLESSYLLLGVEPIWYRSKGNQDNPEWSWYGFSAEQVETIDPRLVFYKTEEVTTELDDKGDLVRVVTPLDDPEPDGVAYDRFVPHLLNIIKDLESRVKTLEAK
tara:strand:- start:877 stop:2922 length:2046 start_codon:yes stop_codon:yes gene_type:complete